MQSKCQYTIKLVGSLSNLTTFQSLLQTDAPKRIGTGLTIDTINQTSVNSLILHGHGTQNVWKSLFVDAVLAPPTNTLQILNLLEASQIYDMKIEFFTNESSDSELSIMEHYLIQDGCLKEHQLVPAFFYDISCFASKQDAQKACDTLLTDEEWDQRKITRICRGGLPWEFTI